MSFDRTKPTAGKLASGSGERGSGSLRTRSDPLLALGPVFGDFMTNCLAGQQLAVWRSFAVEPVRCWKIRKANWINLVSPSAQRGSGLAVSEMAYCEFSTERRAPAGVGVSQADHAVKTTFPNGRSSIRWRRASLASPRG